MHRSILLAAFTLPLALVRAGEPENVRPIPDRLYKEDVRLKQDKEAEAIIKEVLQRYEVAMAKIPPEKQTAGKGAAPIPTKGSLWWAEGVASHLHEGQDKLTASQGDLFKQALEHSTQVRVFADLPLIRETGIREARGMFNPELTMSGRYRDDDQPVGSTLQTGGPSRFREDAWTSELGVRKKFETGTEMQVRQSLGRTSNNSVFFSPQDQGRSQLSLTLVQPLLRGAGLQYNQSVIEVSRLDARIGASEFLRQTESHLLEISRSYWALYLARAFYVEKMRLARETEALVKELESRKDLDAAQSQILRARSAFAARDADTIRAALSVRNAEARIKAMVNAPEYAGSFELIPAEDPVFAGAIPETHSVVNTALHSRPEIQQGMDQLRSSIIRERMQRKELLPQLNLVLEGSLNGLEGQNRVGQSYANQFNQGSPSYGAGVVFSIPLGNDAAKARYDRRQIEVRQQVEQLHTTIETVLLEARIAQRELTVAQRDIRAKFAASESAAAELKSLVERKGLEAGLGAGGNDPGAANNQTPANASDYLERLLSSQERHSIAREEFLRSLAVFNVAFVNLERAKGTLLRAGNIRVDRQKDPKNPGIPLLKLTTETAEPSPKSGDGKSVK
jgi:outer membrane protein TolC